MRSQDRTEPPIGAKVTMDLVKKFGEDKMKWVVDVVFDDRATMGGPMRGLVITFSAACSRLNSVPDAFQPSRYHSTGWHRRRRRNVAANQY